MRQLHYERRDRDFKELPEYDKHAVHSLVNGHGDIVVATFVHREGSGMKSKNGPIIRSGGGWRRPDTYANDLAAATDGCRLSKGMSNKFAGLGLPIGGAKTITFVHNMPELVTDETAFREVMRAYGHEVLPRIGSYLIAEDVGTKPHHMLFLKDHAPKGLVTGFERDVSEVTARGVIIGIEAALEAANFGPFARLDMASYAIEGVGAVGGHIVNMLWEAGARNITICDVRPERAAQIADGKEGIVVVPCADIRKHPVDVFVPCALGGTINAKTLDEMNTFIICGCANNQLLTPQDGIYAHELKILLTPDFIVNAGGLTAVVCDSITWEPVETLLPLISKNLKHIFTESKRSNTATSVIADALVRERVAQFSIPV